MTKSSPDALRDLLDSLRAGGHRVTRQREVITHALLECPGHPSAYEVHEAARRVNRRISLATVYTTLSALVESAAIFEVGALPGGETRYETNARPHANFRCRRCGRVEDIFDAGFDELRTAVERRGHELGGAHVVVLGICADCRTRANGPSVTLRNHSGQHRGEGEAAT